ncbi:hypothetical protein EYR40_005871 [Pleurotus pulmonarius]|nr:hypothetical protein EYR36_005744 [Pleurotus pulmonarius]KAF4602656.1 hypothetical protein EYR40_005871 [Pleurotus pulmonarius]
MTPRLTVILEREEPGPGITPGVFRINRQVFVRKLRSDKRSDVVPSQYADAEPKPIVRQDDTDAKSTRSSSPFASNPPTPHSETVRNTPRRDTICLDIENLAAGHDERQSGPRFSSEPPRKTPEYISFPAPSTTAKDSALQPLRRPFKDKDSEGCTTWYTGSSNSPIARPPSTVGVYGDLYLHSIRGTNRPPLIWLMDNHSTWQRIEEGCTHPYITDRCLRIRGSGEPSWVLKASLATMRHRKEKVARS